MSYECIFFQFLPLESVLSTATLINFEIISASDWAARRCSASPGFFIFRSQVSHSAPKLDSDKEWVCLKKANRTLIGKNKCLSFPQFSSLSFSGISLFLSFFLPELINKLCLVCSAACVQYPPKGPISTSTAHTANWQSYPSLQQGPQSSHTQITELYVSIIRGNRLWR